MRGLSRQVEAGSLDHILGLTVINAESRNAMSGVGNELLRPELTADGQKRLDRQPFRGRLKLRLLTHFRVVAIAAVLACPAYAHAVNLSLTFTGTVSPGSTGDVFPFDQNISPGQTNFDGQPVTISMSIVGSPGNLNVSSFSAQWSNQTYALPFTTSWSGVGLPNAPENDFVPGFFSTVSLDSNGGSITIFPDAGYVGLTDSDLNLSLNFAYSGPHNPFSTFVDNGLTGGGNTNSYLNAGLSPLIDSPYDASTNLDFILSGVSLADAAPEPGTWAMLVIGLAALGGVVRRRRASPGLAA